VVLAHVKGLQGSTRVLLADLVMEETRVSRVIGASSAVEFRGGDSRVVVLVLGVVGLPMVVVVVVGVPKVAMVVSLVGEDEEGKDSNF
jgi:hypothetical protein